MAESSPARRDSSSGESRSLASAAMRRTSSRERAIRLLLARLGLQPVQDGRDHAPLALVDLALEGLDVAVLEEDALAGEADVHRDGAQLHLVHLLAAVRAVAVVEVAQAARLVDGHVPLDALRELALLLRVLLREVVVLGLGGLHGV